MTVYRHHEKWMYDFQQKGARGRKGGFATKQAAKAAEAEARKNLKWMNTDFISLCENRLNDLKLRRTGKWFHENHMLIKKLIIKWGKKKAIERADVEKFLDETARSSASNANAQLKMIRSLFNHGIEKEMINYNPTAKIKKYPVAKKKKYIPPIEDIKKVLSVAKPEDRLYLLVVAHTLGRVTAVNNIESEYIGENHLSLFTRKARNSDLKEIVIPMNAVLKKVIAEIKPNGNYLFVNPKTGKPYQYRKRLLKGLCKKAGVKYFSFHCLRHYGASKLDNEGVPLTDIQKLLGHERATTTDTYLQSLRGSAENSVKKLEDLE